MVLASLGKQMTASTPACGCYWAIQMLSNAALTGGADHSSERGWCVARDGHAAVWSIQLRQHVFILRERLQSWLRASA